MHQPGQVPSARRSELLERAYDHVLDSGLVGMSLRPLAEAVGSSPRVLLFLFGSKDGLVRALLTRARQDEMALLDAVRHESGTAEDVAVKLWAWLAAPQRRHVLTLWVEAYAQSLINPTGAWAAFAEKTVDDWLTLLAGFQPHPTSAAAVAERTAVLATLRGALLDLLATGEIERTTRAVHHQLMSGGAGAR